MSRSILSWAMALSAISPAFAGDWQLVARDRDYFLVHPERGEVAIQPAAGAPRFLAEVPWLRAWPIARARCPVPMGNAALNRPGR